MISKIESLTKRAEGKAAESVYLSWLRRWPSALSGIYSHYDNGVGYCEAAHVRMVEFGAGTGIKPEYFAIPLTHEEHRIQHEKGYSELAPVDWWQDKAIEYLTMWLNGVEPPPQEDYSGHWKKTYLVTCPAFARVLYLMFSRFFRGENKALKVTIEPAKKQRSGQQNRLMWSDGFYNCLVKFYNENPDKFLELVMAAAHMKAQAGKISKDDIHEACKWFYNGGESTARMNTQQFGDYLNEIESDHVTRYGLEFPPRIYE